MQTMTWRGHAAPVPDDLPGRPYSVLAVLLDGAPACVVPGQGLVRIYRTRDDDGARPRERWTVETVDAVGNTASVIYAETASEAMVTWADEATYLVRRAGGAA